MVELSTRIMAHPARREWAEELSATLDAPIIWDEVGHPWDTGRRALLSGEGTHVMVIQDDALLSVGLVESVTAALEYSGQNPVGLYASESRTTRTVYARNPSAWWIGDGPTWGVAVVIPTAHIRKLVRYGDRLRAFSYDQRLRHFYQGRDCWYTVPSLVDHRTGHGSLLSKGRDRRAQAFGSGLRVDWSQPPLVARQKHLYPTIRMTLDGQTKTVRKHTRYWERMVVMGWTELEAPEGP